MEEPVIKLIEYLIIYVIDRNKSDTSLKKTFRENSTESLPSFHCLKATYAP